VVIATHIILMGYGHWLPNDIRGSLSKQTFSPELRALAQSHFGMKTDQPTDAELRAFSEQAASRLAYKLIWFGPPERGAIVHALGQSAARHRLAVYACAVLNNHVHILVGRHAMRGQDILPILKEECKTELVRLGMAGADHPVFSASVNCFFKSTPQLVRECVTYIQGNFAKHDLPAQVYPFVTPYEGQWWSEL
jgi:hypothetical protein